MAEDDFDPTGMTIQQIQAAGHDVSVPDQPQAPTTPAQPPGPPSQQEFDPTGMTVDQLQAAGVSIGPQPTQAGPAPEGGVTSLLRSAAHAVIPTAAAFPGMIAGGEAGFEAGLAAAPFLGPLAPAAPAVGAFIGGAAGGMGLGGLAGEAQEKVLNAAGVNDEAQRRTNVQEHPIMTGVGEFLPAAVTFEVGDVTTKIAQRLLMGGGMGALDIAQQKLRGEKDINYGEALTQAAGGALFTKARGFVEPMAAQWARLGKTAGGAIPGVEAGREYMTKNYPPGRPDLSDYTGATDLTDDKTAVQQRIPATSPNRGAAGEAPPPRQQTQPFTGFDVEASAGNKDRQFKPELQPKAPTEPGQPSSQYQVVNSPADDATIASALAPAGPPPETENPAAGMAPQPPIPEPQPVRQTGLSPEDQEAMRVQQLPFDEQLKLLQQRKQQQPPAAQAAVQASKAQAEVPPPPAAQVAAQTSKGRPKLTLPKTEAPQEPAGALATPPVEQTTPQKPAPEGGEEFANLAKALNPSNANVEVAVPKPRPGRFTNMEVSDKTIKALRATGNAAHAELADKLNALPPGQEREQQASRIWAAMHSQTGEVPEVLNSIRARSPESYNKLEVKGYTNPITGKPVRTKYASDAIAYSRIHDVNDRLMQDKALLPKPNETEEQVTARAQNILDAAKVEAKAEAQRMLDEANRPGSNLKENDKAQLIEAAKLVGNGKLPVENYAMSRLMKPPAWRLQRHAKDFLEGKFPEDGTIEPYQKFLADEALIRGTPEDYATFVKNNIAEATTAKKPNTISDLAYAEAKQAARKVAQGKTNEQAEPGPALARSTTEEPEETLGERLKREKYEDRILDKLRSMKYNDAADRLEAMPLGEARDKNFKLLEDRLLKTKQQPMARDKIPRPSDSLGYDKLNEKILEAGLQKVEEAKAAQPEAEKPSVLGDVGDILKGEKPLPQEAAPPKAAPTRTADEYAKELDNRLRANDASIKNFTQQSEQILDKMKKNNPELFSPELYEAKNTEQINKLPADLRNAYYEHLSSMEDAKDVLAHNMAEVAPEQMGQLIRNHTARVLLNGPNSEEYIKYASGRSDDPMLGRNLKATGRGTMKERAFNALEYANGPQAGQKQVISYDDPTGFTFWNDYKGTKVNDDNFKFEDGKEYVAPDGQKYIMTQAPENMIERNALLDNGQPPRYARNLPLSIVKSMRDLVQFGLEEQFFGKMKSDPEFLHNATTDPNDPRVQKLGWKRTDMPTFSHWYMEPKLADFFDDYYKPGFHDDALNYVRGLSQGVTKLIYLFPTVHMMNVAGFGFVQRGAEWLKPGAYQTLAKTSADAMRHVLAQDDVIKDLREKGLTLMSGLQGDPMTRLGKAAGEVIKNNPRNFELIAKILGVNARDFVKNLYDKSSHYMWTASDVIVVQAVLEKEAQGMSRTDAINAVERVIPNYRIGTHFLGSGEGGRFMAKLMADPATMAFGPYHVGVVRAIAGIMKRSVTGKGKDRTEALGQLAAMAFLAAFIKPALDKVAQAVTGNQEAEVRPMGPLTIPINIVKAGLGEKDIGQAVRDTFTVPPLATTALSLIRNQNFAGRPIVQPEDVKRAAHGSIPSAGRAAVGAAQFAARGLVAPYNLAVGGITGNKESIPGVIRDQMLGISNPTPQSIRYEKLKPKYDLRALKQERKTEKDPIKQAYDALIR